MNLKRCEHCDILATKLDKSPRKQKYAMIRHQLSEHKEKFMSINKVQLLAVNSMETAQEFQKTYFRDHLQFGFYRKMPGSLWRGVKALIVQSFPGQTEEHLQSIMEDNNMHHIVIQPKG